MLCHFCHREDGDEPVGRVATWPCRDCMPEVLCRECGGRLWGGSDPDWSMDLGLCEKCEEEDKDE